MSRPYTGKVIKHRKEILQKNGDTYIYDQEFQYDPLLKKTLRISNKLVAKIPKGSDNLFSRIMTMRLEREHRRP